MYVALKPQNIFIAEGDKNTRHVLRLLLGELGHRVVGEAADGELAVELCLQHKPDIAFLDSDMPKLNGNQAAEKIRQENSQVRIIITSSLPTVDAVQQALQAGASGFMVKPFSAGKVADTIENCLKHKQKP